MAPDWEIVDAKHVRLRAERAGGGGARVCTIQVTCTDSSNKSTRQYVAVNGPHDKKWIFYDPALPRGGVGGFGWLSGF